MSKDSIIKLKNVSKFYYSHGVIASGFTRVNLEFKMGEFVAITGESGSGKSTLLNVISGLDSYEEGEMYINGEETSHYTESDFEDYRRKYIGNIFQSFNLVNSYTVYQNIELVLLLNGASKRKIKNEVYELIKKVDLWKFRNTKVSKLSGGQKQRVAIARALAKDTPIIIADEPTGNLDSRAAEGIVKLLAEIAKDKLVIIVTHNYEQVEEYVTRKIKMHDGKVLEDKTIKEITRDIDVEMNNYKNIKVINKLRLGIRNAFNIFAKCALTLLVYLFLCVSVLAVYTEKKAAISQLALSGWNNFFYRSEPTRIVIKKNDKSLITDEDFKALKEVQNVKSVSKVDVLNDMEVQLVGDKNKEGWYSSWQYGYLINKSDLDTSKIVRGRAPENDQEIVIESNDYEYVYNYDTYLEHEYHFMDQNTNEAGGKAYKVVGIISDESRIYDGNTYFYVSDEVFDYYRYAVNHRYASITVEYIDKIYDMNGYSSVFYEVRPLYNVPRGKASFIEENAYICPDYYCHGRAMKINAATPYYEDTLNLTSTGVVTKDIWTKDYRLSEESYYSSSGVIFINPEDYNSLFNKGDYQSSVFVDDVKNVDTVVETLNNMGYKTLAIKDALVDEASSQIFEIMFTIFLIGVIVVSFFISYFVITIIMKSKNVYFGTIRMLGANSKVSKQLLSLELFVLSTTAFIVVLLLSLGQVYGVYDLREVFPENDLIKDLTTYMTFVDFIVLYVITTIMSLLIAARYSRKLFGLTAINSIKEEV